MVKIHASEMRRTSSYSVLGCQNLVLPPMSYDSEAIQRDFEMQYVFKRRKSGDYFAGARCNVCSLKLTDHSKHPAHVFHGGIIVHCSCPKQ